MANTPTKDLVRKTLKAAADSVVLEDFAFADYAAGKVKPGVLQWHPTEFRPVVFANATEERLAYLSDLNKFGTYRGAYDASSNAVPTPAVLTAALGDQAPAGTPINAGDEITISVAGTIAGLAAGAATLSPGDVLKAIKDNATTAADFIAIQRNSPDTAALGREVVPAFDLVADTGLVITAAVLKDIDSITVRNAANRDITAELVIDYTTATTVTITSALAETGCTARLSGSI